MQEECLVVARTMGSLWSSAMALNSLAQLAFDEGKLDQATALLEESLALLTKIGDTWSYRTAIWRLGGVALANDDPRRAAERFAVGLSLQASERADRPLRGGRRRRGWPIQSAPAWSSADGARLLGAAAELREATGRPISPAERPSFERAVATTRAGLSDEAYEAAFTEGRAMPMELAAELALQWRSRSRRHRP